MKFSQCTSCGGKIEFSPQDKALKCINCGNLYPIKYTKNILKHPIDWVPDGKKLDAWSKENRSCKCGVCGAQITLNKYDIATNCQYCNSSTLQPLNELPGLKPEKIIPFKINKEQAKIEFDKRTKKRKFLPNNFKRNLPHINLGATYISSFAFDALVNAKYRGTQRHTKTRRDSNGRSYTETYYTSFSGTIEKQYFDIVVEASDKISQKEISYILPYDFNECYDYDNNFIKGYNVGYYNQGVEDAEIVAKRQMYDDIEDEIRAKYSSIESLTIDPKYSNVKYNYTLLPAYFVNFKYKDKPYFNLMNGQTGVVTGSVPRSGVKITLFILFILLIIGIPLFCILFL